MRTQCCRRRGGTCCPAKAMLMSYWRAKPTSPLWRETSTTPSLGNSLLPLRDKLVLKPPRPNPVHASMRDRRSGNTPPVSPCSSVKNPRNRCQQHIAPVEMRRSLIEMRKPKQQRRHYQRCRPPHAPFQKILQPPAKIKLFGHCNEEKDPHPR